MCIKLIGVARGSVRELKEDYGDFLRQHDMVIWGVNDNRTIKARNYCRAHDNSFEFVEKCRIRSLETVANIMLTQISQIDAMLAKVLKKLESDFLHNGGIRESMSNARRRQRGF